MERNPKVKKIKSKTSKIDFGENVDEAIKKAVDNALMTHKRAGVPVAVWRDEKVVLIQPEEIFLEKQNT
jgi:hypothetical protein